MVSAWFNLGELDGVFTQDLNRVPTGSPQAWNAMPLTTTGVEVIPGLEKKINDVSRFRLSQIFAII